MKRRFSLHGSGKSLRRVTDPTTWRKTALAPHRSVCHGPGMARPEDIPQPTRDAVLALPCPSFDTPPFVGGPPLAQQRIAILSSAALIRRGDNPFPFGSGESRFIAADTP